MRKFLSVILFFVLTAPAIADDQCPMGYGVLDSRFIEVTNLLNEDTFNAVASNVIKDGHKFKSTVADTDSSVRYMSIQFYYNYSFLAGATLFPEQIGWHRATFTIPSDIIYNSIRIKRDGRVQDIPVWFDMILPPGTYTIGMEIFSDDTSVVGGFEFGNIVIVEGNVVLNEYITYKQYVELPSVLGMCTLCPPNTYKDFVGNVACTPCPNRTMSPAGATSIDECGHVLHVDDYIVFMPVGRRTEHGLCTMFDGKKYCADVYEKQ